MAFPYILRSSSHFFLQMSPSKTSLWLFPSQAWHHLWHLSHCKKKKKSFFTTSHRDRNQGFHNTMLLMDGSQLLLNPILNCWLNLTLHSSLSSSRNCLLHHRDSPWVALSAWPLLSLPDTWAERMRQHSLRGLFIICFVSTQHYVSLFLFFLSQILVTPSFLNTVPISSCPPPETLLSGDLQAHDYHPEKCALRTAASYSSLCQHSSPHPHHLALLLLSTTTSSRLTDTTSTHLVCL